MTPPPGMTIETYNFCEFPPNSYEINTVCMRICSSILGLEENKISIEGLNYNFRRPRKQNSYMHIKYRMHCGLIPHVIKYSYEFYFLVN